MRSISQLAATFTFQSYYSTPLLFNAILPQTNGNPIVDSTRQFAQNPGVGVALHPCSRSPVAIRFQGGASDSAIVHLTPGQKLFVGPFDGFEWGLPFGWLGGGAVILYVLANKDADVDFPTVYAPTIFHRQRVRIEDGSGGPIPVPGTPLPNWPLAFPWSFANRSVAGALTPQQASPLFRVIADIVGIRYNAALLTPLDLVIQFVNTDGFDLQSPPDQGAGYSDRSHFWPITIPANAFGVAGSVIWLPPEIGRFGGDAAEFHVLDPAGEVAGETLDVVRYGRFM